MAEEDLARAQNPQNPLRERAKMAGIFPDFLARGLKVGPILGQFSRNLRDFFPISSRASALSRTSSRARASLVSFFWVGCEEEGVSPYGLTPLYGASFEGRPLRVYLYMIG